jgi:DNA topoisomerase-2
MEYSTTLMRNKARFIEAVSTNDIDLLNGKKSKDATIALLEEMEFVKQSDLEVIKSNNTVAKRRALNTIVASEELELDPHALDPSKEFDYLLSMPLSSLTAEKIEALNNEAAKMNAKMEELKNTSAEELWKSDLDKLESHLNK